MIEQDKEIEIKVGQRWVKNKTGQTMRIMAIAEKCAMVRNKGGMPYVVYLNEIPKNYTLNTQNQ